MESQLGSLWARGNLLITRKVASATLALVVVRSGTQLLTNENAPYCWAASSGKNVDFFSTLNFQNFSSKRLPKLHQAELERHAVNREAEARWNFCLGFRAISFALCGGPKGRLSTASILRYSLRPLSYLWPWVSFSSFSSCRNWGGSAAGLPYVHIHYPFIVQS